MKPTTILTSAVLALTLAGATPVSAVTETNQFSFTSSVTNAVPDGDPNGLNDILIYTGIADLIVDVDITLNFSGGFNGDLYVYVVHDNALVVLLNRIGKETGNPFGYAGSGLSITLDDQAENNVHWYEAHSPLYNPQGQLLGTWQPDGRNIDPDLVDENSPVSTSLSLFNGKDPTGQWRLFVADLSDGGQSTLESWTVHVTTAAPEPTSISLLGLSLALFYLRRKRT